MADWPWDQMADTLAKIIDYRARGRIAAGATKVTAGAPPAPPGSSGAVEQAVGAEACDSSATASEATSSQEGNGEDQRGESNSGIESVESGKEDEGVGRYICYSHGELEDGTEACGWGEGSGFVGRIRATPRHLAGLDRPPDRDEWAFVCCVFRAPARCWLPFCSNTFLASSSARRRRGRQSNG